MGAMTSRPALRRARAREAGEAYGGVLSRELLAALGVDHRAIGREIAGMRWRSVGYRTIALHLEPLPQLAVHWRAVWETSSRLATLDGVSALLAAGLTGFDEAVVHVSVPHGWRPPAVEGVRRHHLTRVEGESLPTGIPRATAAIAAVRAAHWAVSDRQAALLLVLPVQQRLVRPGDLVRAAGVVRARTRRALVPQLVADIADGAHSLGELDFAALCREHGLPEPERQVVRRGPFGRIYLDVRWAGCQLVVEIDGAPHRMGLAVMDDNLRQNEVVISGERVLRLDLVGLRLQPRVFMAQVVRAFHAIGS